MTRPRNPHVVSQIMGILGNNEFLGVAQLARRVAVSPRTLIRIIRHMQTDLGIDVRHSKEVGGYVLRDPNAQVTAGYLSRSQATALAVATQLAASHVLPLSQDLAAASGKVADMLARQLLVDVQPLLGPLRFKPAPSRPVKASILNQLAQASTDRRTCEMVYHTAYRNATSQRRFDPYVVEMRGPDWYTVGWCHLRQQVLIFAVSRIKSLKSTGDTFVMADDFDPDAVFRFALGAIAGDAPTDVVVEFDAAESRWVGERSWHHSQRTETLPGGRLRVTLQVAVTPELRKWILGYGASARVLAPPRLIDDIADELRRAAVVYAQPPGRRPKSRVTPPVPRR